MIQQHTRPINKYFSVKILGFFQTEKEYFVFHKTLRPSKNNSTQYNIYGICEGQHKENNPHNFVATLIEWPIMVDQDRIDLDRAEQYSIDMFGVSTGDLSPPQWAKVKTLPGTIVTKKIEVYNVFKVSAWKPNITKKQIQNYLLLA